MLGSAFYFGSLVSPQSGRMKDRSLQAGLTAAILMPALWSWVPARFLFPATGLIVMAVYSASFANHSNRGLGLAADTRIRALRFVRAEAERSQLASIEFTHYPATWPQMSVQTWIREGPRAGMLWSRRSIRWFTCTRA